MRLIIGLICIFISLWINATLKSNFRQWALSPLPRPEVARLLSGEFTALGSDYFLMKAAIFYGGEEGLTKAESLWLSKALYLTSYLDPYYFEPYWMAGSILPWEGRIQEAKNILKQGLIYLPQNWQIPFYLGFVSFYFEKNYKEAARYFLRASKLPGAPSYLPLLAARLAVKGNETKMAIIFLQEQLKRFKDIKIRTQLEKRLNTLKIILFLEEAVKKYQQRYRRLPSDLNELVDKKIIPALPLDPYGGRFYLTKEGRVWSTSNLR